MAAESDRALIARIASHHSWAQTTDRTARTQPGRDAMWQRWLRQADPEGVLPEKQRQERAEALRKAHYARMALKSAQARRARAGKRAAA